MKRAIIKNMLMYMAFLQLFCSGISFNKNKENDEEIYSQSDDVGAHYMYVVNTSDEKIIVSSWGEKYVFDDNNADWVTSINVKINYKDMRGQQSSFIL